MPTRNPQDALDRAKLVAEGKYWTEHEAGTIFLADGGQIYVHCHFCGWQQHAVKNRKTCKELAKAAAEHNRLGNAQLAHQSQANP